MKLRWDYVVLGIIIVALFWVRMALSVSVENLSYESYSIVRSVETIQEEFTPLKEDALSLLVPQRLGSPVNDYILALFTLITPLMYKIVPNLLSVLLLIPVFLLTFDITKSKTASIVAVILTGTSPWVFSSYLNTPSPVPLSVLIFMTIIYLLNDTNNNLPWILGLTIGLTFLHPLAFLLVFSFLAIIILLKLERFGVDKKFVELFFFTLLLSVWFNVLVYKEALFTGGVKILWRNLPTQAIDVAFGNVNFINILYGLGVVTFLFGVIGIYHALFESRMKSSFPLIGTVIAIVLALIFRVVELKIGFFVLTTLLSVMAAYGLLISARYFKKTKASWIRYPLGFFIIILFLFTAVLPALSNAQTTLGDAPSEEDIQAFRIISEKYPEDIVILTAPKEAPAVQYFSGRTTLMDPEYLLLENTDEIISDIDTVYRARFTTRIVNSADKWGFDHILFSNYAREKYNRNRLAVEDSGCLSIEALTIGVRMYRVSCSGVTE